MFEDFEDLVDFRVPNEERSLLDHLRHDAPDAPNVDARILAVVPQQHLRSPLPQGDDFVGERVHGEPLDLGQAEVRDLDLQVGGEQQVLGLQVAVEDAHGVAVCDAEQHLVGDALDLRHGQVVFVDLLAQVPVLVLEH